MVIKLLEKKFEVEHGFYKRHPKAIHQGIIFLLGENISKFGLYIMRCAAEWKV